MPSVGRHLGFDRLDAPLAEAYPHALLAADGQHVGLFVFLQGYAQLVIGPVHRVGHDPRRTCACRQRGLGGARHGLRHARRLAARLILGPLSAQVRARASKV